MIVDFEKLQIFNHCK